MAVQRVDYDKIAPAYDRRYAGQGRSEITDALLQLGKELKPRAILEAGCGTGRWLSEFLLHKDSPEPAAILIGLDLSSEMLIRARHRDSRLWLARGRAEYLPFPARAFDLVYCVHALHHFERQRDFIFEAYRALRPGGALAIIGMDPRIHRSDNYPANWYLYHYFEGALETDLKRFPSRGTILDWMAETGFDGAVWRQVDRISRSFVGREVFDDPFLAKDSTSQLVLLSEEAYSQGLLRIQLAISKAKAAGEEIIFPVDISIMMIIGWKR